MSHRSLISVLIGFVLRFKVLAAFLSYFESESRLCLMQKMRIADATFRNIYTT
jgi:hypothetical protein